MTTRGKKTKAVEEIQEEERQVKEIEEDGLDYYQEKFDEIDSVVDSLKKELVTSRENFNELKGNVDSLNTTTEKMFSAMMEQFEKLKGENVTTPENDGCFEGEGFF